MKQKSHARRIAFNKMEKRNQVFGIALILVLSLGFISAFNQEAFEQAELESVEIDFNNWEAQNCEGLTPRGEPASQPLFDSPREFFLQRALDIPESERITNGLDGLCDPASSELSREIWEYASSGGWEYPADLKDPENTYYSYEDYNYCLISAIFSRNSRFYSLKF